MKKFLIRLPDDVGEALEKYVARGERTAFIIASVRGALLLQEQEVLARQAVEFQRRVEAARQTAEAIVDGLGTDERRIEEWIAASEADGVVIREVIRVARERRESSGDE